MEKFKNLKSPEEVVSKLKKLVKKIEDHFNSFNDSKISHAQFRIIIPILRDQKGYSMQELSEIVGVDKSFVSRTIADLENKGIVQRDKEAESNERNYKIFISEEGRRIIDEITAPHRKHMEEWMANISKEEMHNFVETLFKLAE